MPGDLVSGRYPLTSSLQAALGLPPNAVQSNLPVRSNLEFAGINDLTDQSASLVSGKLIYVPVPVDVGTPISKVSVLAGATAAETPTHSFAALYAGTLTKATILGEQSADGLTAAIAASARFDFTLASKYIIQPADVPFGYILAGVSVTATGHVPSLVATAVAAAAQYKWFADTPLFGAKIGTALGGAAPASLTLSEAEAIANPPVVFLA
jgi:hypothetical protein